MFFESITLGFGLFVTPLVVALIITGIVFGLFVGAMPGLGPLMGIILALPFIIELPHIAAMGFLIGIFVGGSCGGSISAILLRIPGTPLAAATLFDGYPMARKGQAANAVGIAISSSALGGLFGGIVLILFSPVLAAFARGFTPPEFTLLAILGLLAVAAVSGGSLVKGALSGCFGLLLATIGTDEMSVGYRFTFDSYHMLNGFHLVSIVVGIFALSEMVIQMAGANLTAKPDIPPVHASLRAVARTLRHPVNLIRSSAIGTFFGALPGAGGVVSSFASYAVAKSAAKPHEVYGEGEEGGVIATESANNATVGGSLIPSLSLGIPGDAISAVVLAALIMLGFFPGPALFEQTPEIVGGIFLSYIAANIALLFLGILLTPVFVYVLRIPQSHLIPAILLLCALGTFALQASVFDLWAMLGFGLVGLLLRLANYPLAPIVIGTVLGPVLENSLRRTLLLSHDGLWIFVKRPVSLALLCIIVALLVGSIWYAMTKDRRAHIKVGAT